MLNEMHTTFLPGKKYAKDIAASKSTLMRIQAYLEGTYEYFQFVVKLIELTILIILILILILIIITRFSTAPFSHKQMSSKPL